MTDQSDQSPLSQRTINDFGTQWTTYDNTDGYFGSAELLADFIKPFDTSHFTNARVADIGSGTGRFAAGLLEMGAKHVYAVEPSQAISVIENRFEGDPRITALNIQGAALPRDLNLDFIISIGVVHHIPTPEPVIKAAYEALKPGGQFIVWLYGKEGSRAYLALALPLRLISRCMTSKMVAGLAWLLEFPLWGYIQVAKRWPWSLPLKAYMTGVLDKIPKDKRRLVIYDQLKPAYAKYYTRDEASALLHLAPFSVEIHDRMGYSWVAIGVKPKDLGT
ncbi:MAG: class I SAM-dependent methyltransferase [Rhodospirillales bacterium]|nr:class I SAM-dependent methyltransferase [Rhodospirillales bacterium]